PRFHRRGADVPALALPPARGLGAVVSAALSREVPLRQRAWRPASQLREKLQTRSRSFSVPASRHRPRGGGKTRARGLVRSGAGGKVAGVAAGGRAGGEVEPRSR